MRYDSLHQLEKNLLLTGNNGEYSFRKLAVPVPGENLTLEGVFCTPTHRSGYYHAVAYPKERIILHFTAGQIRSDLSALTRQDYHVSVPFVIGREGTIYQLYSSKYWSGNIGKGLGNGNNAQDKCTIAIEISNYGYLTEREGNLETYYSRFKDEHGRVAPVDIYCSLNEREAYQKLNTPFRSQSYYAAFTNEQYDSLIVLLRYLTAQYNIPRQFLPESKRYITTNDVLNFKGIVSHVNYRESGKWDIGPAFDWDRVIQGVQAARFAPAASREVSPELMDGAAPIRSEEELESLLPAARGGEFENEAYEDINSTAQIEAESGSKAPKKLYALIVGINDYREDIVLETGVIFPRLSGCAGDAVKIEKYLRDQPSFEQHIELLTDQQATKAAIVDRFQNHLGKAGKGDTVLFYYSGHGTQEWADEQVWTSDGDGRLECIACYYDEQSKDQFLLSDKELRYLIKGVADRGAHVVTLFDCCHSGDNTRNGMFVQSAFANAVEKRIPFSFKKRKWEHFVFGRKLSREDVIAKGEGVALPEGLHVQFSACESDESAMEVNGEGVFTKALIETLNAAKGDVTYQALNNRVRQYLKNIYEQRPRVYAVNGDQNLLYSSFLYQSPAERSRSFGDVLYNKKTGWLLNLGAIHGIGENVKTIRVLDPEDSKQEFTAVISTVRADTSQLRLPRGLSLDTRKVYKGYVENMMCNTIRVQVNNVDGRPDAQQALMQELVNHSNGFLLLDEQDPQYIIHNSNGLFYITPPADDHRPLVMPVEAIPESVDVLVSYLRQIAQWEHLRSLVNKQADSNLAGNELEVTIKAVEGDEKKAIPIKKDTALIKYEEMKGQWKAGIEIELRNTTDTPLYCSALFLTYNFGSITNLLPRLVEYIEPGKSIKLQYQNKDVVPFSLNEEVVWYNWKEQREYLKLIVSTEVFDVTSLSLYPLPSPAIPGKEPKGLGRGERGIGEGEPDTRKVSGWGTQTIVLQQPNPEYNKIDPGKLKKMLEDPATADFALGIYFDVAIGEDGQPVYHLKRSVKLKTGKKGAFLDQVLDLANTWARRKKNQYHHEVHTADI